MATRLLLTGGSGFIGTHLADAAVNAGMEVLNLDINPPLRPDQKVYWRVGDLLNRDFVEGLVEEFRPDAIVNLAAIADISFKFDDMPVNVGGLGILIDAAMQLEPRPRLVHVSTQLVVGPGYEPTGPRDYSPYTEYGRTKAASEELMWERAGGLEWVIVRPTNVWGPWHRTFAPSTWKYLQRRWYMLPTGADPVRSYGYVSNVADQILESTRAATDIVNRQVFYVGDEPFPSRLWLDGFSVALTGKRVRRVPGSFLQLLAQGGEVMKSIGLPAPLDKGRLFRISADYRTPMTPTFAALGKGKVSLDQGTSDTVAWLRAEFPDVFPSR